MAFRLRVSGKRACFPRPEFRHDRISYDVLTPFAARAILDAVYWRPEMRWRVDIIHVLKPVRFAEPGPISLSNGAPKMIALLDVDYVIEAHFDLLDNDGTGNAAQHTKLFLKQARQHRYHRPPFLGIPECPASLELIEKGVPLPPISPGNQGPHDLGWIAHDLDDGGRPALRFFRAIMIDGRISIPPPGSDALAA